MKLLIDNTIPPLLKFLHIMVLIGSIVLVAMVSFELFNLFPQLSRAHFLTIQFWICMVFLADFFVGLFMEKDKWAYFKTRFIFLIISIPYLNIINYEHPNIPEGIYYFLRLIPLIRGGYAMFIITSWMTNNKATSLFFTYLVILSSIIYFCTLIFYTVEKGVNTQVDSIGDAFWWASMNVTTVGSNIIAVTTTGKIMTVIVAAFGMLMFPIFTVFITDKVIKSRGGDNQKQSDE